MDMTVKPKTAFELLETDKPYLADLPERLVKMLQSYHAGNGYDEIARIFETPVGTVKSRIHRARERILRARAAAAAAAETMQHPVS